MSVESIIRVVTSTVLINMDMQDIVINSNKYTEYTI